MRIIGCDLHATKQTIAMLDRDSGKVVIEAKAILFVEIAKRWSAGLHSQRRGFDGAISGRERRLEGIRHMGPALARISQQQARIRRRGSAGGR